MAVAFCISGHGFGHASRQVEVVNAFGALRPDQPIHVFTQAARWLLDRTIRVPVTLVDHAVDTGAVQRDSLLLDIPATLAAAAAFEHQADAAAATLAGEFRARRVRVVVCDVPAMPFTAASLADCRAVALANFTWDWIYADLAGYRGPGTGDRGSGTGDGARDSGVGISDSRFGRRDSGRDEDEVADLPRRLGARYALGDAAWRLPMHGGFSTFGTVLDFPWIARRSRRDPADTRRVLGLTDARPLVLVSFGGYGVAGIRLAHHAGAPYRLVLSGGAAHPPADTPADAAHVDRDRLDALGLRYEDLLAACDVVISKPGYGIVSECVANRVALLYTERGQFAEYPVMVEQMPSVLRCRHLSNDAVASARWDDDVAAVLAQPWPAERPLVNGADVAAGMLSAMV